MKGLRENINPVTQTLKVFLAISSLAMQGSLVRQDKGQHGKPLGSRSLPKNLTHPYNPAIIFFHVEESPCKYLEIPA